jgi:type II secretory pathway pseudopilin PulG
METVIVVAVVGVLASIAIASYGRIIEGTRRSTAAANTSKLNNAVATYGQVDKEIVKMPNYTDIADELEVLALITLRDPGLTGSPFLTGNWPDEASDDVKTYRFRWTGRYFETLYAGDSGNGIQYKF